MKDILVGTAMVVVIVAGLFYVSDRVKCYNFFGVAQGCVVK